uniref:AFP-like domain-containing protein n=1 Tax=Lates calcarifer TaxID=8187 RepID=A0A4W6D3D5_LATCA
MSPLWCSDFQYYVYTSTLSTFVFLGKSVVAKVDIPKGTELKLDMFAVKVGEPKGIPPENMQELVGKKLKVDVKEDNSILTYEAT